MSRVCMKLHNPYLVVVVTTSYCSKDDEAVAISGNF